jgi:spore maturation protein CgeB
MRSDPMRSDRSDRSGLDIAFFGSSLVSAYWNGAATYYRGIIRALAERGHRITFYEPDAFERQSHRDIPDPEWAKVVVYPATGEGVSRALDQARGADLVVKASGVGVFDELLEAAVPDLRRPGGLAIFWDVDAPATLDRLESRPDDPFHALVPRYDLILTYGGGEPVVTAYERAGARTCIPIYNALDPTTHFPTDPDPRFAGDLGFLGNRLPDREARVEELFLQAAAQCPDRTFLLGGNGWGDKPMPPNVHYLGHVYTRDHNTFNCSALAVLNISRESMARYGFSPATRVFEAAGAAACLITDAWEGIETFLDPESEVLVARSGDEVAEHLRRLTPERAHAIGRAALRRILSEHTYAHRATQVEEILDAHGQSHRRSFRRNGPDATRASGVEVLS